MLLRENVKSPSVIAFGLRDWRRSKMKMVIGMIEVSEVTRV
jgi:hypothetical protein